MELHVRPLGGGTGLFSATKAINIGNVLFPLDAADVYVAMTRGSNLLV